MAPISQQARGQVRLWYNSMRARHREMQKITGGREFSREARRFLAPSGAGRTAGRLAMDRLLPPALAPLSFQTLEGRNALRCWSSIIPTPRLLRRKDELEMSEDMYNGALVAFTLVKHLGTHWYTFGGGNLMVPLHALGRVLERDPKADLTAVIYDGHRHLSRTCDFAALCSGRHILPAGDGAFIIEQPKFARHDDDGNLTLVVEAHTWVSRDMLFDRQIEQFAALLNGPDPKFGQSWGLPHPLRRIEIDAQNPNVLHCCVPEQVTTILERAEGWN